jgi:hypothetical protein
MTITLRRGDLSGKFSAENLPGWERGSIHRNMRSSLLLVAVSCACVALSTVPAVARAPQAAVSPDGRWHAEVRGGDSLWIEGERVWPEAKRRATIVGQPRWARASHAVAVLAEEKKATRLVVILVGNHEPTAMEWLLPPEALPARWISWLAETRVAVGPRELEPKLVASFKVSR